MFVPMFRNYSFSPLANKFPKTYTKFLIRRGCCYLQAHTRQTPAGPLTCLKIDEKTPQELKKLMPLHQHLKGQIAYVCFLVFFLCIKNPHPSLKILNFVFTPGSFSLKNSFIPNSYPNSKNNPNLNSYPNTEFNP